MRFDYAALWIFSLDTLYSLRNNQVIMPKDIIITDGNETYYTLQVPVNEFVEAIISDTDINELEFFLNTFINYKEFLQL